MLVGITKYRFLRCLGTFITTVSSERHFIGAKLTSPNIKLSSKEESTQSVLKSKLRQIIYLGLKTGTGTNNPHRKRGKFKNSWAFSHMS